MFVRRSSIVAALCGSLVVAVAGGSIEALGQAADAPADWTQLERSQQLTDYRLALREGGFDEASKKFLTTMALPQLGLQANRGSIERVRRRMRELLCGDAASDPKAVDAALQTISDFTTAAARNERVEPVVRINALLLLGELKGKDGKPWPAAAAPLAAAVADPKLPLPLKIVAAQGLDRQVEAAGPAAGPTVGPVLVKLLAGLPEVKDRTAADWLTARALAMLADLGTAAPPEAAPLALAILEDASRTTTIRARAAAALAATGAKAPGIDQAKAVAACRATARAALEAEKANGERRRELGLLGSTAAQPGQPGFGGPPPGVAGEANAVSAVPEAACRRVAWELMTFARALGGADGKQGISAFRGPQQQAAQELAATLREAATMIDATPDETSILDALAILTGGPAPAPREAPAAVGEAAPAPDASEPAVNPFGQ